MWTNNEATGNLYIVAANVYNDAIANLNGTVWRKRFTPNLTYFISDKTMLGNKYGLFGNNYVPYNVVIGKDYKVKHTGTGMPSTANINLWMTEVAATDIQQEKDFPNSINLSQNYPNPFNPETTINFSIKAEQSVKLTVFNANGQLVEELINANLKSGEHAVVFNATNLNSGVYYYKLETANNSVSRKMILIK